MPRISKPGRKPTNHCSRWSAQEDSILVEMFQKGSSIKQVSKVLKRSRNSIIFRKHQMMKEGHISGRFKQSTRIPTPDPNQAVLEYPEHTETASILEVNSTQEPGAPAILESLTHLVKRYGVKCTVRISNMEITLNS